MLLILVFLHKLGIACDEDDNHLAVLYCTVCASHLCLECSELTHATKTLHIHKRIPLSGIFTFLLVNKDLN